MKIIYQKIWLGGNILREVFLLKIALLPFQNELRGDSNDSNDGAHNKYKICRSRDRYLLLRDKVTSKVLSATNYSRQYCDNDDVNYIYAEKVWLENEIKLKEFKFKVLHGILACNKNLKQWKIRMRDSCDVHGRSYYWGRRGDRFICFCPDHECTTYAIMYIRSLTWVYCICHQVYCICNRLTSRATLGCTTLAIKCPAEAMLYFRSPTWVYCICSIKYTAYPIMFIRSLAWVYCICQQVHWIYHQMYCISYHVNQEPHLVYYFWQQVYCICHHVHREPHLGVLHLSSSVLHMPSSNIRSNTGVYYISHQVCCRGHTWVYCICHRVL